MAYDRTALKARFFDRERARKWDGVTLTLILNAGAGEETEVEVEDGWLPERQRKFAEINSMYLIQVTARESLTLETMKQADRLRLRGVVYQFTFDPPGEAPEIWNLYATELKVGGIR